MLAIPRLGVPSEEYHISPVFPERNEVEERLDLIYSLKRKYGNNILEILNYKEEIEKEIQHIENLDDYNRKLKKELKQIKEKMTKLAINIHNLRKE